LEGLQKTGSPAERKQSTLHVARLIAHGPTVINIVRRQEQVDLLHSLGAEFVLQGNDPNFSHQFRDLAQRLKATLILDALGGKLARQLLNTTPAGSILLLYANLSGEEFTLDPHGLWSEDKRIAGFSWETGRRREVFFKR